ncbi:hypothetical protein P7K49_007983 [Saguinus oedipus]|uniref:Guanylyl cyclase-activating protein 2 n=1 Tax=Saguinus oedipus TaxID=9490 RepID=A0ABQ9VWH5_SAGOE|nr:hypothetical protein P7K49_007983 [Saguinus oedipus]
MGQEFSWEEAESAGEIDVAELQEWYKKFVMECPSGTLFMHEFKRFFRVTEDEEASQYVEGMFRAFDKNGDNTIDFLEYVAALNLVLRGTLEHKLKWTFKIYDKDGNGCIDRMELLNIVEHCRALREVLGLDLTPQSPQTRLRGLLCVEQGLSSEALEVTKEVIKYKTDPEMEKELQPLGEEIVVKSRLMERCDLDINQLKQEIQALKDTKPQVQTKEVVQEILQFRDDPQTKEELPSNQGQSSQRRRGKVNLERERASQGALADEGKSGAAGRQRRAPLRGAAADDKLRAELLWLQSRRTELELQARPEAQREVQRMQQRLAVLEQEEAEASEVTREQKAVLQQAPQQACEHALLQLQLEEEQPRRQLLEGELETLRRKPAALEKAEVKEKVVFFESIEVERGDTEQEIQRLKSSLEGESRSKRKPDAEVSRLEARLSELEFRNSKSSQELDFLNEENHKLQLERQNLQLEAGRLQSEMEIPISAAETRDPRNMNEADSGTNHDSRLRSLERELDNLKRLSKDKDLEIDELQKRLAFVAVKREQRENHLRRHRGHPPRHGPRAVPGGRPPRRAHPLEHACETQKPGV